MSWNFGIDIGASITRLTQAFFPGAGPRLGGNTAVATPPNLAPDASTVRAGSQRLLEAVATPPPLSGPLKTGSYQAQSVFDIWTDIKDIQGDLGQISGDQKASLKNRLRSISGTIRGTTTSIATMRDLVRDQGTRARLDAIYQNLTSAPVGRLLEHLDHLTDVGYDFQHITAADLRNALAEVSFFQQQAQRGSQLAAEVSSDIDRYSAEAHQGQPAQNNPVLGALGDLGQSLWSNLRKLVGGQMSASDIAASKATQLRLAALQLSGAASSIQEDVKELQSTVKTALEGLAKHTRQVIEDTGVTAADSIIMGAAGTVGGPAGTAGGAALGAAGVGPVHAVRAVWHWLFG